MPLAKTDRGPADDKVGKSLEEQRSVDAFLRDRVKEFNRAEANEAINRQMALDDIKFKSGDQWPEQIKATRTIESRPCLTINKMKTFVHQITNDQRQNRPSINISPVGDRADPETAKMMKGLIRQIERQSNADVAYDTGFESAVTMGWGYWRILTEYEDEDTFDQVIKVRRIRNPFRVYLDPDSEEPDGSDAKWFYISDLVLRSEFKEQWPHANINAWEEGALGDEYKLWSTSSHVRIAEYWCYETKNRTLLALADGHVGYEDELSEERRKDIADHPDLVENEREVPCKYIKCYKITAMDILEEYDWNGKYLPIVKIIGDETDIEGKVKYAGLVRDAKDPQRMYNYWVTSETEQVALAPIAPWVMEEGAIEGHEERWKNAHKKPYPYLLYKGTNIAGKPAPPPQRQQFAGPPAGVVQAKISAAQDMQAVTGIRFDATMQERTYDESGKALRELKRVGELGSFHYIDNLARSLRYTGKILVDLIPKTYDTKRVLTILREDGGEERVTIDPTQAKPYQQRQGQDGRLERIYNPKLGDYDVAVTIGPSFATKRAEAADSMLAFMKAVPQAAPIIGDLIAKNMDWPGAEEIQARMAAMLPPHLQQKNLQNLPPEAKGFVASLMNQMQQLKQEHDRAIALLGDKEKDRAIDREELANDRLAIQKDLEAKLTKVTADFEAKMAALAVKSQEQTATGPDPSLAFEKIAADFEAKVMKIVSDLEQARMKQETEFVKLSQKASVDHEKAQHEKASLKVESGMRRQADMEKFEKLHDRVSDRIKELEAQIKELGAMEIVFDRDPKTNRIAKARKIKSNRSAA